MHWRCGMTDIYRGAASRLLSEGWSPLPLTGKGDKSKGDEPVPTGFTGYVGIDPSVAQVAEWERTKPTHNIALRLPPDVCGIDVDDYVKGDEVKRGLSTLAELEAKWGPLPATLMSTSRENGSGIRFFRVPNGTRLANVAGADIDVIQRSHRYVVVAPSIHPEGRQYRFIEQDSGVVLDEPWPIEDLPPLPDAWLQGLKRGECVDPKDAATDEQVAAFGLEHTRSDAPHMLAGLQGLLRSVRETKGKGRHDTLVHCVTQAMCEVVAGAYTLEEACEVLSEWWRDVMDDPDRIAANPHTGCSEFSLAIAWAIPQAKTDAERVAAIRHKIDADPLSGIDTVDRSVMAFELWSPTDVRPRPVPHPALFHGIIGEFALEAAQYSEADPVAIFAQVLTMYGVAANRSAYVLAGNNKHTAALFVLIIGATAKARKGTSGAVARAFMSKVAPDVFERRLSGFGSGEAIIAELAGVDGGDAGPRDIRALIYENEFGGLLSAAGRQGATISETIRNAWDLEPLANRTRSTGNIVATDYHLGAIGHITEAEFRSKLTGTDVHNGMVNRWLMFNAGRGNLMPDGGNVPNHVLDKYAALLKENLRRAWGTTGMQRTPEAKELWADVYEQIAADDPPGALGGVTSRGDAQTLRLSIALALADGSGVITAEHVAAAFHVWNYCRATAAHIFGDSTGNADADRLLEALREAGKLGMTATAQRDLFSKHKGRADNARALLEREGLAASIKKQTGGSPATITYAIAKVTNRDLPSLSSQSQQGQDDGEQVISCATKATEYLTELPTYPLATATEATEATEAEQCIDITLEDIF